MEARSAEMKQVVRCEFVLGPRNTPAHLTTALFNSISWSMLWNLAPIGVTLISFFW